MKIKSEKNSFPVADVFSAILFLFFIQQLTFLVESIYMLNLLNTQMDIRALGISFLFLPGLLFALKHNKTTYFVLVVSILFCTLLNPFLSSPWRIFSAGIGAGLFLTYLGMQLTDKNFPEVNWGQSAALATLASILFRVVGQTLDISTTGDTRFIGWLLIIAAAYLFSNFRRMYPYRMESATYDDHNRNKWISPWMSIRGLGASFIFIYFVFSSPAVIARWTETSYSSIHIILVLSIWIIVFFWGKNIIMLNNIKPILIIWNAVFIFIFLWNILLNRISFPTLEHISPVIVEEASVLQSVINFIMLALSPIIFLNIGLFAQSIKPVMPSKNAYPFLRSSALIIVCVFMLIFTNTWGYVGVVSKFFRNQFALPFALAGLFLILPFLIIKVRSYSLEQIFVVHRYVKIIAFILVVFCCGFIFLIPGVQEKSGREHRNKLTLMTYNIQQGVDYWGNKNFEGQLERIREIDPDILCLQESDASRISGGNSDVVRYFSSKLGYYSYYGPKTVTGTYGTAILSRFPLHECQTIFTYSSKDEIGTAVADISVGDREITIINSQPAGDQKSREEHIDMVISLASDKKHVIAMGDYNFTQDSPYYKKVTQTLKDSWLSLYPEAIGPIETGRLDLSFQDRKTSSGKLLGDSNVDMTNRIDHIFLSKNFNVKEAYYLPAPESETDHPLHFVVVRWNK